MDLTDIDKKASAFFDEIVEQVKDKDMPSDEFLRLIAVRLAAGGLNDTTPVDRVALMIAVNGAIEMYCEHELGISFKPKPPEQ